MKKLEKKRENKRAHRQRLERGKHILISGYLILGIFLLMLLYFLWFEISGKNSVLVNPLNNRTSNMEQMVMKGDIVTEDGVVIATTQNASDGTEYRLYPFGSLFAHTVGYSTKGGAGLESTQKIRLLTTHNTFVEQLRTELMNQKSKGDVLHVTLNYALQSYCSSLLGGRNGTIAVMETKTGRILAMVSYPDFDPAYVDEEWNALISQDNTSGNLLNRTAQGRYAPGSTFKLMTLLEYIRENPDTWQDFSYTCTGTYQNGSYVVNCHEGHAHGTVDIYGALAQSCNGAFITMGLTLDPVKWKKLCEDCGYNQSFSLEFQSVKSNFSLSSGAETWEKMQAAIGQGTTTATPLLNLMITSAIANKGTVMKPHLIDGYISTDGSYEKWEAAQSLYTCMTEEEADLLKDFMMRVVRDGSGYQAASSYCQTAGKTGSAQYSSEAGRYHAWFTGFAPYEDPEIAVTVLIEDGGAGGETAAPIAGAVFDYYFSVITGQQP